MKSSFTVDRSKRRADPCAENGGRLAVVGGGPAGIAAAVFAHQAGMNVTLFEARRHLGGRAASLDDGGDFIDNGRHLLLEACTETLRLISLLDADDCFERRSGIRFLAPSESATSNAAAWRFRASSFFPGRLRFLPAFCRVPFFSFGERLVLLRTLARLKHFSDPRTSDRPFGALLDELGVSENVRARFWCPVTLSALCDLPEKVSARAVRKVIFEGVLTGAPTLILPSVPLRTVFHDRALNTLRPITEVQTLVPIKKILLADNAPNAAACLLADGTVRRFDRFILAVEPRRCERLLRDSGLISFADSLAFERFVPGAISAVHLWLDRPLTEEPALLSGEPGQWVFPFSTAGSFGCQVLISGSHSVLKDTPNSDDLFRAVEKQLADHFPNVGANVLRRRLTTVPDAVTVFDERLFEYRPSAETPLKNLMLSGDWTRTGWPCTLEGAIRSAKTAVEQF